jgi:methyl-accepting chemotaxis protein
VEEVSRTMQSLLDSAGNIADSARGVFDNAQKTRQTTDGMSGHVQTLFKHTARIAELLEVIRDIADRSDLLALNASLEATRAGEAGRAFALVAAEMRRLAERITASVVDVKSLLVDIRTSAASTASATDDGRQLAEGTTESARQITMVTQQQRTATGQVLESMREISSVLGVSVTSMREIRASSEMLRKTAEHLNEVVGQFKIEG